VIYKLQIYLINKWADLGKKYKFLPYPRLKYRYASFFKSIYEVILERLICPIKKHKWRFNSGNGVFCSRCKFYAKTRDLKN